MAEKAEQTKKPVEIYALIDPRDSRVRYIGKASNSMTRFKGHLRETRRITPVYQWIASLREIGLAPVMEVIATCQQDEWKDVERREIARARSTDVSLLNVADGGSQPYCSQEVRAANGVKCAKIRVSTPLKAHIYRLKHHLGQMLKHGQVSESAKVKLRIAAHKCPSLFGEYAAL